MSESYASDHLDTRETPGRVMGEIEDLFTGTVYQAKDPDFQGITGVPIVINGKNLDGSKYGYDKSDTYC